MALGAKIAVGTIGAGLVAGGIYLFILSPRQERAKVQREVAEWGDDFRELEVCILGDKPLSSDATEAVTLRELTLPVGEDYLKECLQLTKDLQRPEGYGSGSMSVETAWYKLKDPVGRLASRMALRTASDEWYRDPEVQRGAIAKGIDELGAAYDQLRKAAGMKPAPRHGSSIARVPEAPAGIAIDVPGGGTGMAAELQAGVLAVETPGQILLIRGPDRIDRFPLADGIVRAAGGAPWGLWAEAGEREKKISLRSGALDEIGRPSGTPAVIHTLPLRVDEDYGPTTAFRPFAAVGSGDLRAVVFGIDQLMGDWNDWRQTSYLSWSRDRGATWSSAPYDQRGYQVFVSQVPARVDVFWGDPELRWLSVAGDQAAIPEPRRLTPGVPSQLCRAPRSMWWVRRNGVTLEAGGKVEDLPPEIGDKLSLGILACDDTRAAHVTYAGEYAARTAKFEICTADGCGVGTPIPAWDQATVVAAFGPKHGFTAVVLADGYLVLWRAPDGGGAGLRPRPVYHMPNQILHAVAEWDGTLYALVSGGGGARLVPLPL